MAKEQIFSVEEAAKWCGISRNAFYMRYKRGQIKNIQDLKTHKLYFTREEIENFRATYVPFIILEDDGKK